MNPVLFQNLSGFVNFVDAENDNRLFAETIDGCVEVVDVDFRLGQRFEYGVHAAGMQGNLDRQNRRHFEIQIIAFQDGSRAIGIVDYETNLAVIGNAGRRDGFGADIFQIKNMR